MFHTVQPARAARWLLASVAGVAFAADARAQVVLRQVYGGGGTTGALYTNDFVELYNAGGPQSLSGWSVQVASAGGATWSVAPLPNVVLDTGRSFLLSMSAGGTLPSGQSMAMPAPDATSLLALATTDGKVALVSSTTPLSGSTPTSASIVDLVGYGPLASWNEPGAPFDAARNAPAPSNDNAIVRWDCSSFDSGVNRDDWAATTPSPRNSALAPIVGLNAAGLCSPHIAEAGQSVRLDVEASTCPGLPLGPGASVVADLSAIGGAPAFVLGDGGAGGDLQAGDGVWSATIAIAPGQPLGTVHLPVTIVDGALSTQCYVGLEIRNSNAPDNDSCVFAALLAGPLPASVSSTFAVGTAEHNPLLSASATTPPGSMGARRGRWYSVLGTGATMTASTCASPLNGSVIPDTVLMVLSGTCDALSVIAYDDDAPAPCGAGSGVERRSNVSWCSAAGQTYWIWVAPFSAGGQNFAFTLDVWDDGVACSGAVICATCAPPGGGSREQEAIFGPARNDGCDSSSGLFVDAAPSFPAERWNGAARQYGGARDHDWYRFQAASATNVTATLTAQFHGVVELWELSVDGECDGATMLASSAASERCGSTSAVISTAPGAWYAARVVPQNTFAGAAFGGFAPGGDGTAYALELAIPVTVPNDECANAEVLAAPSSTAGSTVGATVDAGLPVCDGPGAQDLSVTAPGVWYSLTLPGVAGVDDRVVYAALSSADFDARLSVFEDACGAMTCVTANDDADSQSRPRVAWRAVAGTSYSVLVHGAGNEIGAFVIDVETALPVSNDDCAGAAPLSGETGSIAGELLGATGAASSGFANANECGSPYAFFDVWYELTVACDAQLTLDACGATDTVISVHSACPDGLDAFALAGACNDDGGLGCAPGSQLVFPLTAGVHRVRVAGAGALGSFVLSWAEADSDGDGVRDCSDGCPLDPLKLAPGVCGCGEPDVDTDGDGTLDCDDGCPLDPFKLAPGACGCGVADTDGDGDGTPDCLDLCPSDPNKVDPGQCGCGVPDTDGDGDGVADCVDGCPLDPLKTAPGQCGCGVEDTDSDGDGTADCVDGCPLDPLKIAPGACGCGVADDDTDGDGVLDCFDGCPLDPLKTDPGICGCGEPDVDSDGDGTLDCNDGCPLDPLKVAPGLCGCGVADVDTDGDGAPDCVDLCPLDPFKTTPGACGCGQSEDDGDLDGVPDCVDNCPALANPGQEDCDLDGAGDACELAAGTARDLNFNGTPDDCELGAYFSYCTAGTSTNGCTALMTGSGVFSASATSGFVVSAGGVEGQKQGIVFYGITGPSSQPWFGGSSSFKCVKGPLQRIGSINSGGTLAQCDGVLSEDVLVYFATHPGALGVPAAAGQLFNFQAWYRDPPAPSTTNLSDAMQATCAP